MVLSRIDVFPDPGRTDHVYCKYFLCFKITPVPLSQQIVFMHNVQFKADFTSMAMVMIMIMSWVLMISVMVMMIGLYFNCSPGFLMIT